MGEDIIESRYSAYFVYDYDNLGDLYVVRGISFEEISVMNAEISYIPEGLLKQIRENYAINHKLENFNAKISYSSDRVYALIDFNGRTFKPNEVDRIINAYNEFVTKLHEAVKNQNLAKSGEVVKFVDSIVRSYNEQTAMDKSYTISKK